MVKYVLRIFIVLLLLGMERGEAEENAPLPNTIGKKGFGVVTQPKQAGQIEALRVSWFYSWGVDIPKDVPTGMEFIPMIWGWRDGPAQDKLFADLTGKKSKGIFHTLLGFNEPDGKDQANLPVKIALEKWPQMMGTGLRLGSPACVHPDALPDA